MRCERRSMSLTSVPLCLKWVLNSLAIDQCPQSINDILQLATISKLVDLSIGGYRPPNRFVTNEVLEIISRFGCLQSLRLSDVLLKQQDPISLTPLARLSTLKILDISDSVAIWDSGLDFSTLTRIRRLHLNCGGWNSRCHFYSLGQLSSSSQIALSNTLESKN